MKTEKEPRVIVALDFPSGKEAIMFAEEKLDPDLCAVKVGLQLYTAEGPPIVQVLTDLGFKVFLDLKFGDIPETMAQAILVTARLKVWMTNFHAEKLGKKWTEQVDGKPSVLERMNEGLDKICHRPIMIGVTVLTSMDDDDLNDNGIPCPPGTVLSHVLRLTRRVEKFGFDGVVSSGQEAKPIRNQFEKDFLIVTPGIRLPDGDTNDQMRIVTPEKAISDGADYLVIGRPITGAKEPLAVLNECNRQVANARASLANQQFS
jgi:orotidine-5'-phosphate decarboxylase